MNAPRPENRGLLTPPSPFSQVKRDPPSAGIAVVLCYSTSPSMTQRAISLAVPLSEGLLR